MEYCIDGEMQSNHKKGYECKNLAQQGSRFCATHSDKMDFKRIGVTLAGSAVGNLILPGMGGVIAGGAVANLIDRIRLEDDMSKTKVFVSFDFDNDKSLKDFIIGQARLADSPFDVADHSLKEAAPEKDWLDKARKAIGRSDVVIVMLGSKTRTASGVLKEVRLANELKKHIFQIIGYRDGSENWRLPNAGRVYRWNWDNLKKLLS